LAESVEDWARMGVETEEKRKKANRQENANQQLLERTGVLNPGPFTAPPISRKSERAARRPHHSTKSWEGKSCRTILHRNYK
jgi:hypothetical protein